MLSYFSRWFVCVKYNRLDAETWRSLDFSGNQLGIASCLIVGELLASWFEMAHQKTMRRNFSTLKGTETAGRRIILDNNPIGFYGLR